MNKIPNADDVVVSRRGQSRGHIVAEAEVGAMIFDS